MGMLKSSSRSFTMVQRVLLNFCMVLLRSFGVYYIQTMPDSLAESQ